MQDTGPEETDTPASLLCRKPNLPPGSSSQNKPPASDHRNKQSSAWTPAVGGGFEHMIMGVLNTHRHPSSIRLQIARTGPQKRFRSTILPECNVP